MRLVPASFGVALCLVLWHRAEAQQSTKTQQSQAEMAARLVNTFEHVCLETLPLLTGAVARLKKLEFELTPLGEQEMYELWSEKLGLGGHLHLPQGDRKPSCGFLTETVTRQDVEPLVEAVLASWLGTPAQRLKKGEPDAAVWQVPAGGNTLSVRVDTSLSDDPAMGASVTLEEGDRQ